MRYELIGVDVQTIKNKKKCFPIAKKCSTTGLGHVYLSILKDSAYVICYTANFIFFQLNYNLKFSWILYFFISLKRICFVVLLKRLIHFFEKKIRIKMYDWGKRNELIASPLKLNRLRTNWMNFYRGITLSIMPPTKRLESVGSNSSSIFCWSSTNWYFCSNDTMPTLTCNFANLYAMHILGPSPNGM